MIFSNENAKIGGDRMTSDFMKELLSKDEKITVEYKNCQYGIQEDVYEHICGAQDIPICYNGRSTHGFDG